MRVRKDNGEEVKNTERVRNGLIDFCKGPRAERPIIVISIQMFEFVNFIIYQHFGCMDLFSFIIYVEMHHLCFFMKK